MQRAINTTLDSLRTCSCSQSHNQVPIRCRQQTTVYKTSATRQVAKRSSRMIIVQAASSLEGSGLYTTSNSLLGPSFEASPKTQAAPPVNLNEIALETDAGVDYTALRDALQAGNFELADDETRAKLIELAGEAAKKRGWVYFSEVKFIPEKDFKTIDTLWKAASNGNFGYSVQKEVWIQNRKMWPKFFKAIDWTVGENSNYRKWPKEFKYSLDAPKGHLPLTNALRGTRLFEAIMEHPAFATASTIEAGSGVPDWLK